VQEGHELVTSGPYRIVRHPIYAGILVALLGSALVNNVGWFVVFVLIGATFVWRINREERYMAQLFPEEYLEYKKRTVKKLIPLVW
jgi:protein-S-isoprenylcysteine O-methyltransferase Ste14